jgi:hypothetical protein
MASVSLCLCRVGKNGDNGLHVCVPCPRHCIQSNAHPVLHDGSIGDRKATRASNLRLGRSACIFCHVYTAG